MPWAASEAITISGGRGRDGNEYSGQELGGEGDTEPSKNQWNSDGLCEEFAKVVKDVQSCAEGDLSRRGKPKCRGVKIGEGLLRAVDDLVEEEFERERRHCGGSTALCMQVQL